MEEMLKRGISARFYIHYSKINFSGAHNMVYEAGPTTTELTCSGPARHNDLMVFGQIRQLNNVSLWCAAD
jgi:hypothetical protein